MWEQKIIQKQVRFTTINLLAYMCTIKSGYKIQIRWLIINMVNTLLPPY